MTAFSFSINYFKIFILILNFSFSYQKIIYFGDCPIVIGDICDSTEIKFYLYTRFNPKIPEYIEFKDGKDNLTESLYNHKLGNKMIIHGYNSDMNLDVLQTIKNEYLTSKSVNIWMINYPNLVKSPCYLFSVHNIKYVGKCIASFINRLKSITMSAFDVHVIGFSLGGQVTNHIAQYLPFKLPRITGLEPALPLFYTSIFSERLDSSDAQFVDVIHTNAFFQGQIFPCGHVDFYVNGGIFQPGCTGVSRFNCYHHRAPEYFAESINTNIGFWGWYCPSFLQYLEGKCKPNEPFKIMGEYVDQKSAGIYLLNTNSKSPYAKGKNITNLKDTEERRVNLIDLISSMNNTISSLNNNSIENMIRDYKVLGRLRRELDNSIIGFYGDY